SFGQGLDVLGTAADVDVEDLEDLDLLADIGGVVAVDDDDIGSAFAEVDGRGESRHAEAGDEDAQSGQGGTRSAQSLRDRRGSRPGVRVRSGRGLSSRAVGRSGVGTVLSQL